MTAPAVHVWRLLRWGRTLARHGAWIALSLWTGLTFVGYFTPIRELDNRSIGSGGRGPLTEKLQGLFFDVVAGKSERYGQWLHPVSA